MLGAVYGVLADGGPNGVFDSGRFAPDTKFSHVFDTPGEYPYFCLDKKTIKVPTGLSLMPLFPL